MAVNAWNYGKIWYSNLHKLEYGPATIYTSEGSKKVLRIKKIKHWYQKNIFPTEIYFNGGLDIYIYLSKIFSWSGNGRIQML